MSLNGIKEVARVLSDMQQTRIELIGEGVNKGDNQDIRLGQLLEDAKDAIKERFAVVSIEGLSD